MNSVNTILKQVLVCGFGSGLSPIVPGTTGSLGCAALWIALAACGFCDTLLGDLIYFSLITLAGWWAARGILLILKQNPQALRLFKAPRKSHDPGFIVIDEWSGMALTLMAADLDKPLTILLAFVLFRAFDIIKPGPVRMLEELPGEAGVMSDDIAAGALGLIVLAAANFII